MSTKHFCTVAEHIYLEICNCFHNNIITYFWIALGNTYDSNAVYSRTQQTVNSITCEDSSNDQNDQQANCAGTMQFVLHFRKCK